LAEIEAVYRTQILAKFTTLVSVILCHGWHISFPHWPFLRPNTRWIAANRWRSFKNQAPETQFFLIVINIPIGLLGRSYRPTDVKPNVVKNDIDW